MNEPVLVVDDHLLLRILLDDEPAELRPSPARIATTGLWYHRLCRAVGSPGVTGSLSRHLATASPNVGALAVQAVTALPETISLLSLRQLAWPMARLLGDGLRLNLLSLEALAAAEQLGGRLCLAGVDRNPPLIEAAEARGRSVCIVTG